MEALQLFSSTMSQHSVLWIVVVVLLWTPLTVLLNELAHAAVALGVTDGGVSVSSSLAENGWALAGDRLEVELSPWIFLGLGRCTIDAATLRRPRSEAWVAAAGPAASLLAALVLAVVAIGAEGATAQWMIMGASSSAIAFLVTATPMSYGRGFGGVGDSDGRVVWRVLRGRPPGRDPVWDETVRLRPGRQASPVALAAVAVCMGLALLVDLLLFVALLVTLGVALYLQRVEGP